MSLEKYRSRKFIVTMAVLGVTVYLSRIGGMNADTALVLTGLIASYNIMQGWVDKNESQ